MPAEIKFPHGFLEQVNSLAEGFDGVGQEYALMDLAGLMEMQQVAGVR